MLSAVNLRNPVAAGIALVLALELFGASGRGEPPTLVNEWAVPTRERCIDSTPAIGPDGTIYFGAFSGKLWALKPDGSRAWTFEAGREIQSSPAVGPDGTVYFGSRDRKFYAVGPNGRMKWSFQTGLWVDSSPALGANGVIYFGSWDQNFYALNPDGSKRWQFATSGPIDSSPAVDLADRIYFGSHDHKFYALAPDGTKLWDFATGGSIISSPAIDAAGNLYFTSVDGFLYALEANGQLKWRLQTGGITGSSPVLGPDGTIYVGVNMALWAVDPAGKRKWTRLSTMDAYQQPIEATPVVCADESVLLISAYGLLAAVAQNLSSKWHCYLGGSRGRSSPVVGTNGTVYINGWVPKSTAVFLALPGGMPLARSPWPKFRGDPQNTGRVQR